MQNNRTKKILSALLCPLLLLSGCSSRPTQALDGQAWNEDWTQIGSTLGIEAPEQLTFLEYRDVLAADGLYYAAWTDGNCVPYENSDGDTADLYDAQLYLISNETDSEKAAEKSCQIWLASAKDNYEILSEETITCNEQPYTLITYDCVSGDAPYDRGVSAFGACNTTAVCAELTCIEGYDEDLTQLLTDFLEGCHYSSPEQTHH